MFLLFKNEPVWLSISYLLIPLSFFLILKGIETLVKGRSTRAIWFVGAVLSLSLLTAAFFTVFLRQQIPFTLLNFSLPFGALAFWLFDEFSADSVFVRAFVFVFGVFCNASAIGCLIEFAERLFRLNKELNKLDE